MEVWYFDYLDKFPSALFTSSASFSPLSVMTSNSVLYLFLRKCIRKILSHKKKERQKRKKISAVAFFVSSEGFVLSLKLG